MILRGFEVLLGLGVEVGLNGALKISCFLTWLTLLSFMGKLLDYYPFASQKKRFKVLLAVGFKVRIFPTLRLITFLTTALEIFYPYASLIF